MRGVSFKDFVWEKGKDGRWRTTWVPLGDGQVPLEEVARVLEEIGFQGPIENQPEYPDGVGGQEAITIPRERVIAALRRDQEVLRRALSRGGPL